MRAFTAFFGLFLLVSSSTGSAHQPSGGCPFGYSDLDSHLESGVRQKRHSHPFDVRPGVGPTTLSEQSLDVLLKKFLPKYSNSLGPHNWNGNNEEKVDSEPLKCGVAPANCLNNTQNLHFRTIDGACNNLMYPDFGIAAARYRRLLRPNFVEHSLPNARLISLTLFGEKTLTDKYRTVASMQWGQFLAHDITQMSNKGAPKDCCAAPQHPMCDPIKLAPGGPIARNTGKSCLSFPRSATDAMAICPKSHHDYPERLTMVSAYLDLSSLYGNSLEQSEKTRTFKGGQLRTSFANGQHWLPVSHNENGECDDNQPICYNIPDKRNRFTPTIAVLQTIFMREHNRLAEQLAMINPHYNDERLFQEARKINIAQYQKISYYEYLRAIMGSSLTNLNGLTYPYSEDTNEYVNDYDESVDPTPYAEFSQAAFRYSHTQVPGWFSLVAPNRYSNQTLRLSDFFERAETIRLLNSNSNMADLIRGMATQLQKRTDTNIDVELKHFFDRKEFEDFGGDLKSFDIQRGRDFGLASYNDARELCGLRRASYWEDFATEIPQDKIAIMRKLYASPDDVELNTGGTLETHMPHALFGPTLGCIVNRQFRNTRQGDRFFFEHENHLGGFTRSQLAEIRKVSGASLFCLNVQGLYDIQPNVFIFPNARNVLLSCNDIPQVDITKWQDLTPQLIN